MKKVISLFLVLLMLALIPGQVLADEVAYGEKLTVVLDALSFETDFYEHDVNVVYRNTSTAIIADVVDKDSGAVLATYEEDLGMYGSGIQPRGNGPYEYERHAAATFSPVANATIKVYFKLKIYEETVAGVTTRIFRDLIEVTQAIINNNNLELEFSTCAEINTTHTESEVQVIGILCTRTAVSHSPESTYLGYGYTIGQDNFARYEYAEDVSVTINDIIWSD